MLINSAFHTQKYNVVIDGKIHKKMVLKYIAEHYILSLDKINQEKANLIPVTNDGKEILFE
jgi:hypothetical protein